MLLVYVHRGPSDVIHDAYRLLLISVVRTVQRAPKRPPPPLNSTSQQQLFATLWYGVTLDGLAWRGRPMTLRLGPLSPCPRPKSTSPLHSCHNCCFIYPQPKTSLLHALACLRPQLSWAAACLDSNQHVKFLC